MPQPPIGEGLLWAGKVVGGNLPRDA